MFTTDNVKSIIESKGIKYFNKSVLCAKAKYSNTFFKNGIGDVLAFGRNHVLHFGDTGLSIIAVNDANGALYKDEGSYVFLPNEKIINNRMTFGPFNMKLHIDTTCGEIVYKISKRIPGKKWHNDNLSMLIYNASAKNLKK